MVIYLYNITCDASVLDKTSYLNSNPVLINAVYKDLMKQDLLNPVLITDTTNALYSFNYIYNSTENTYYFVRRGSILSNNRYELQLEKDVLFSNLTKIKNSYAIINRSETNGDVTIKDATDVFSEREKFSHLNLSTYKISEFVITGKDNYLIAYEDFLAGASTGISAYYTTFNFNHSDGILPTLSNEAWALGYQQTGTLYRVLNSAQVAILSARILNNESLLTHIKGIYKIPMDVSLTDNTKFRIVATGQHEIRLGGDVVELRADSSDTSVIYAPYSFTSRWVFEDFSLFTTTEEQNYYYQNPYRKYEIWCPFTGWVEIPAKFIINRRLKIYYTLNLENGESTCNIYDWGSDTIISTHNANVMLQISLTNANLRALEERKLSLALNTAIGTLASVASIATGGVGVAGGIISLGKTMTNAITGFSSLHMQSNVKLLSSNSALQTRMDFVLRTTFKDIYRISASRVGRPCNRYALISSENGFFEASGLILTDGSGMYKDEVDKIKMLLSQGVFAS